MGLPPAISKSLPPLAQFILPFLNLIGKKNEFRIVISSPNYMEIRLLWGLFTWEKGEKKEFVLRGTDVFQQAIISNLQIKGLNVDKSFR